MSRVDAFRAYQRDIGLFSRDIIRLPLYPYQVRWANYIMDIARRGVNETVVVEMSRQSGKNETSAQLEVNLLANAAKKGGDIVKTAPTWKPQIINSKLRFEDRAKQAMARLAFLKYKGSMGYINRCGRASIQFLSAEPHASVVGATASLLMEVDEAQDVDKGVFDKKFSPMRASKGCAIVAYGTTWTDDTLLERFKTDVQEGRAEGHYFRVTPEEIAVSNPAYGRFVDAEVKRLGREHPYIKTQYFLEPLASAGRMLGKQQLELMIGDHARQDRRQGEAQIVAGLDFAGADEGAGEMVGLEMTTRDSVALSIGAVDWVQIAEGLLVPHIRSLARYEWVNMNPVTLHSALYHILWDNWRVNLVHCDGTGIGATGTAMLAAAMNKPDREVVQAVTFDSAWNSHTRITFNYLAAINGGHFKDYKEPGFDPIDLAGRETPDTNDPHRHAWWQRGHARLEGKPEKKVRMYVATAEGHDDILISEALMVDAAYALNRPNPNAGMRQARVHGQRSKPDVRVARRKVAQ